MKVWVLEQFGADGYRSVIQVFASDVDVITYLELVGKLSIARGVSNGQKQITIKSEDYPNTSYRATEFEVK